MCSAFRITSPQTGGRATSLRRHHPYYSPLRHWKAGAGKKVAIVGLGGLGHMGVKIAHAMGAEVTVLSQSLSGAPSDERLER